MNNKSTRGRKMRSDNVRVIPEFRDQIDIEKLCQALIEIAKSLAADHDPKPEADTPSEDET